MAEATGGHSEHLPVWEQEFYQTANPKGFRDMTLAQIVAILDTERTDIASASTLYRILRKRKAPEHRQPSKNHARNLPLIHLTSPVPSSIFCDCPVAGGPIEENESDEHSVRLFDRVVRELKRVRLQIVHVDNGHPMKCYSLCFSGRSR